MKKLFLLFLISSFLYGEEPKTIKLQFRAFSWGGTMSEIYYSPQTGKEEKLNLYMDKLTPFMSYEGPVQTSFFIKRKVNGTITNQQIAKLDFSKQSKSVLIILFKNVQEDNLYRNLIYSNTSHAFPSGSMRLYNFTLKNIAMRLGENNQTIGPLGNKVIPFPKERDQANIELSKLYDEQGKTDEGADNLAIAVEDGENWVPAFRSAWPRKRRARNHFFIFPIGKTQYRVHSILEYPPRKKKK